MKNQGGGYALPSKAQVYLSRDMAISGGDKYLESVTFGILMAGQSSSGLIWVTVPSDIESGDLLYRGRCRRIRNHIGKQ